MSIPCRKLNDSAIFYFQKVRPLFFLIFLIPVLSCVTFNRDKMLKDLSESKFTYDKANYSGDEWQMSLLYQKGCKELEEQNFNQALSFFLDGISKFPESRLRAKVFLKLGLTYHLLKQYSLAADYLSKYLKIGKRVFRHPEYYFLTAYNYYKSDKFDEAISYFEEMKKECDLIPEDAARTDLFLGFSYFGLRKNEAAEKIILNTIDYTFTYKEYLPDIDANEIGRAYYILGEINYEKLLLFQTIRDNTGLNSIIAEKTILLLKMEKYFGKAIETGFSVWSLSSFKQLAEGYLFFYNLLKNNFKTDSSKTLSDAAAEKKIFQKQLSGFLKKSENIILRGLTMAYEAKYEDELIFEMKKLALTIARELQNQEQPAD